MCVSVFGSSLLRHFISMLMSSNYGHSNNFDFLFYFFVQTRTLASCLAKTPSTAERKEFILDLTRTLIEADIPLEKAPKLSTFLQKHCKQGGSIPAPSHLRTEDLPELYPQYEQDIKDAVAGKDIYIVLDETTDACGRCALAILLQPVGERAVVADLAFFEKVNFTTVSQAVISCLNNFAVDFNRVWAFVSDSASYMKKAFTCILEGLFPNSRHITCFAHLINLVLEVFPEVFGEVNRLCALVKKVFCQAPQRRLQLRAFMLEKGHSSVMPVYAVQTRWGSWVHAVEYLAEYMDVVSDFTATLPKTAKCVKDLLEEQKAQLKAQAVFIVEHSSELISLLTKLQKTSVPMAQTIASKLEDLQMHLNMAEQQEQTTGAHIPKSCCRSCQRKTG
ncbi:uncharacterized protein LOC124469923 [Hypomesus transpacificus]|uniref:uncharacterized protein LOC124469923 n=1 Tax=Hypomesus transpacificus TaxID=137520 RepID=UPI001F07AFD2|nr:uncharacterized protein LOC124469923 [Hypomesus transpacificus]